MNQNIILNTWFKVIFVIVNLQTYYTTKSTIWLDSWLACSRRLAWSSVIGCALQNFFYYFVHRESLGNQRTALNGDRHCKPLLIFRWIFQKCFSESFFGEIFRNFMTFSKSVKIITCVWPGFVRQYFETIPNLLSQKFIRKQIILSQSLDSTPSFGY